MMFKRKLIGSAKKGGQEKESPRLTFKTISLRTGRSNVLAHETEYKSKTDSKQLSTTSLDNSNSEECLPEKQIQVIENQDARSVDAPKENIAAKQISSPASPIRMANLPKKLFDPPQEVTIDPEFVPPSPMKDPAVSSSDPLPYPLPYDHGLLLDFEPRQLSSERIYRLGDPLGDIAMKRQLSDARRLVRLILGKPLAGDQNLLETNTILQAIRSFAMMKQELIDLRKKQEIIDGDPPCILQTLGSPAASTTPTSIGTSGIATENGTSPLTFNESKNNVLCFSEPQKITSLEEANSRIADLESQVKIARKTIRHLQKEKDASNVLPEFSTLQQVEVNQETKLEFSEVRNHTLYKELNGKFQKLKKNHEIALEESKEKLEYVLEEVAGVPKRVLAKGSVRQRLQAYCQTITKHESQFQVLELEEELQRTREESRRKIQELMDRIQIQEEIRQGHVERRKTLLDESAQDIAVKENEILQEICNGNNSKQTIHCSKEMPIIPMKLDLDEEKKSDG